MSEVAVETRGALGLITLTRPKALNALNGPMCDAIHAALDRFRDDPAVRAVVIEGEGEKAFCAGGDVVAVTRAGREGTPGWEEFFAAEYRMNYAIARFEKPYIALMDGITMGGGVGLSVHGRYRIATERTMWAMPETGIGMIPDVGASAHLGPMGALGRFLVLTGARLDGAEALHAGVATHYAPSHRLNALKEALSEGQDAHEAIGLAVDEPGPARLAGNREAIDRLFAKGTVEEILADLDADGGEWATKEAATIRRMSPTAVKLGLELLRRGAHGDARGALIDDYRCVCALKSRPDFYEGVRAQLIDKDRAPKWRPARFEEVSEADVAACFAVPEGGDLVL